MRDLDVPKHVNTETNNIIYKYINKGEQGKSGGEDKVGKPQIEHDISCCSFFGGDNSMNLIFYPIWHERTTLDL